MMICIALLRGINVSGKRMVKMNDLKVLFESLELKNVRTYLQSGNVVFDCDDKTIEIIGKRIEETILQELHLSVPVILKSSDQVEQILQNNPFLIDRKENINHLYVTFLGEQPAEEVIDKLKDTKSSNDEFLLAGKEIYLFCPGGYGNTKLSNNFFENKLKMTATTRNWRTVNELGVMARSSYTS